MVTFYISILNREAYTQISETCDECRVGGLLGSDGKGEGSNEPRRLSVLE